MKKLTWVLTAVIVVLAILCATLWQRNTVEENDLKVICKSSVNAALEHFEEYTTTGNEEEYIAGVAEFRAYMTTYLCLVNEASSAEYLWCTYGVKGLLVHTKGVNNMDDLQIIELYFARDEHAIKETDHKYGNGCCYTCLHIACISH